MRDILPVVVDGLWRQGAKNLAVSLVSAEGQPLPAWTPGAHIDLHLPCGLIRQYSLTGSPAERDRYLLCIARESQSRGGSRYIHDTLRPGQPLMISAPRNHFPLHEGGHVVLLAAGIGITPLLAMAHARAASAADGTFTITLTSTGERWPVPGDKTIAQVLQEHGVAVPLSCEMGICGACLTPVREGTVDHRDTVQSEAEKQAAEQHIALCCSRSLSANLVIDLAG
ncbi:TPA: oxidoreductase [Klebsiella pneumoniae]|nr:oxidoreductase [Klebsiella pneumoniae]